MHLKRCLVSTSSFRLSILLFAALAASCGDADRLSRGVRSSGPYEIAEVVDGGKVRVVATYRGDPVPARRRIDTNINAQHCKGKVLSEELVVDAASRGIRNVVVRLEGISRGKAPGRELTLVNRDCSFHPHVGVAMAGSLLKASNEDPLTHSTHPYYGDRSFFNYQFARAGEVYSGRKLAEPGLVTVKCDVHNWMRAYVVVHDNPYAGVTDADGVLVIGEVPPGSYGYVAWHEKLGELRGTVEVAARGQGEILLSLGPVE